MNKEIEPILDVLNKVDGIAVDIGMALDVLEMYSNFMDEEIESLHPDETWTTTRFLNRHPIGDSTLFMCKEKLYTCLRKLNSAVDTGINLAQQIRGEAGTSSNLLEIPGTGKS